MALANGSLEVDVSHWPMCDAPDDMVLRSC
jgi:hypothetical protein